MQEVWLLTETQLVTGYVEQLLEIRFFHYVISVKYKHNMINVRTGNESQS